jgi:hypothetical protein
LDSGVQQTQRCRELGIDLQRLNREASSPRVSQHLFAQLRGFSGESADLGETAEQRGRRIAWKLATSNLRVADHAAEQVVEVVSDPASGAPSPLGR